MPAGRPSLYNPEMVDRICSGIVQGLSLRQIAKQEGLPSVKTIMEWLVRHEEFRDRYARAKEIQMDLFAEEILDISDDGRNDWVEREGIKVLDHEHVQRSRLRVDARKWLMSKMAPKKYGEKVQIGGDPTGVPVQMSVETRVAMATAAIDEAFREVPKGEDEK